MLIIMARPKKCRNIACRLDAYYFKPRGIPLRDLEETVLEHDELEALRLADLLGKSHEDAAGEMGISRATFGRIIERARKKTIDALLSGKALCVSDDINDNIKIINEDKNEDSCSN
jgi:predicted DNA-binding protein (UPF0251 family)